VSIGPTVKRGITDKINSLSALRCVLLCDVFSFRRRNVEGRGRRRRADLAGGITESENDMSDS
jgi:hypothetical protein